MMAHECCVVAGDASLVSDLQESAGPDGPRIECSASSGRGAIQLLARENCSAIVLEDDLEDMKATELLKRIRQQPTTQNKPVILVSTRDEELDRVLAFELGADDFVSKPYSPRELVLRLRAVLRRAQTSSGHLPSECLALGRLRIDVPRHEVHVDGAPIHLTALEFRLLVALVQYRGKVRTREDLLRSVWKHPANLETRTVDTHVKRLRERLGALSGSIETVRGVGYRFQPLT